MGVWLGFGAEEQIPLVAGEGLGLGRALKLGLAPRLGLGLGFRWALALPICASLRPMVYLPSTRTR